jgi:serine/threonine protein kinase
MNRQAETLFHELADLSPGEREHYFRERGVPAELRSEVEELLRFDSETTDPIPAYVAASAQQLLDASDQSVEAVRCGPYRLTRLLGRGGMGSVYLAERADGEVRQQVAIKILRYAGDEPLFLERFLRERQILAALTHPGIARLLDAGHASDGRPYLAMEYIEGVPIDAYAERLDLRAKLTLFTRLCEAVSFAHRNLIIHRDIKPSNVLVDSSGQPKLLDFGIAKILDAATDQTITQERLLTPEYASPEQVRGAAQSTAGDIYSLGAVLYRLLTGRAPHTFTSGKPEAVAFVISSTEPAAPSKVNPGLPKDLDFILGKALRKEPEERYASVDAFADDIRAFLELRPVRARSGDR